MRSKVEASFVVAGSRFKTLNVDIQSCQKQIDRCDFSSILKLGLRCTFTWQLLAIDCATSINTGILIKVLLWSIGSISLLVYLIELNAGLTLNATVLLQFVDGVIIVEIDQHVGFLFESLWLLILFLFRFSLFGLQCLVVTFKTCMRLLVCMCWDEVELPLK